MDSTKGDRLYDRSKNKVIFSRDVSFDKNNFNSATSLEISDSTELLNYLANFSDKNGTGGNHTSDFNCSDQNKKIQRLRKTPDRYGEWELEVANNSQVLNEPQSVKEALSGPLKS